MAAFLLFLGVCGALLLGYPVALTLAGVSLLAAGIGALSGGFDMVLLHALPSRIYGIMTNTTLIAVPLFIFMGVMLERSKLAQTLLNDMSSLFRGASASGALAVLAVGTILAASTGIVGATVVTLGLLCLPTLLKQGYPPKLATGTICAVGTLGQIIPPSIVLILLGDVLSNAYQEARFSSGNFSSQTLSIGDLFAGALLPGLLLVTLYAIYVLIAAWPHRDQLRAGADKAGHADGSLIWRLVPPLTLILAVLGSILAGVATPTEAAGVGAAGSLLLAAGHRQLSMSIFKETLTDTLRLTSMVFLILVGASVFSLVFRGFGGDDIVQAFFEQLPGGTLSAVLIVMAVIFVLGFILDFIEITYVVVPIIAPVLIAMGVDPLWLGIMIAINLQTSFLTPPFGFALFYMRTVAPKHISTTDMYKGVLPFIAIQLFMLCMLALFPSLALWLPGLLD
jgi:tripartite ATP-independent transporter DctM subunit